MRGCSRVLPGVQRAARSACGRVGCSRGVARGDVASRRSHGTHLQLGHALLGLLQLRPQRIPLPHDSRVLATHTVRWGRQAVADRQTGVNGNGSCGAASQMSCQPSSEKGQVRRASDLLLSQPSRQPMPRSLGSEQTLARAPHTLFMHTPQNPCAPTCVATVATVPRRPSCVLRRTKSDAGRDSAVASLLLICGGTSAGDTGPTTRDAVVMFGHAGDSSLEHTANGRRIDRPSRMQPA